MPPLNVIKPIGWARFISYGMKLPVDWKQPVGDPDAKQYIDGIGLENMIGNPQHFWFTPHNPHVYHQDSCNEIGKEFQDLHDNMLDAVAFAHNQWRLQAKFQNLKVITMCCLGQAGCLTGPDLESPIKNAPMCASWTGNKAAYRDAVAKGVAKAYKGWQDNVMVPMLPFWPPHVAFPGPMGPPLPNIPMPLIACVSSKVTDIVMPNTMKDGMVEALPKGLKDKDPDKQHVTLFDSIATALALAFSIWLVSQQVMNIMGQGPVPTFAPPIVPLGPVMNGSSLPGAMHVAA